MAERFGANGLPLKKKVVETIDEIKKDESTQMIQEILEVNPNVLDDEEVVVEESLEEVEEESDEEL